MGFFNKLARKVKRKRSPMIRRALGSRRPMPIARLLPMPSFEDDFNRIPFVRKAPLGLERLFGRLKEQIRNNPKFREIPQNRVYAMPAFGGGQTTRGSRLGRINRLFNEDILPIQPMPVGEGVPFTPPMIPSNTMAEPSLPMNFMPQNMPMERFPMMRQRFAEGGPGSSSIRPPSSRADQIARQVLRPSLGGTISAAARGAVASPISKFGIPGAIAAGGIALYQIADEMGYIPEIGEVDPEAIGRGAASVDKAFMEVVNEAVDMARDIGAPIQDFVERVKMGYQDEMSAGMPETMEEREILGEAGRTISNRDRMIASGLGTTQELAPPPPVMGEVPMFAEGLDVDIANLEKN